MQRGSVGVTHIPGRQRTPPQLARTLNPPIVINAGEREELIVNIPHDLRSYDPATGKILWTVRAMHGYASTSPLFHDGVIYNISGEGHGRRCAVAVRPGDVPDDKRVIWKNPDWGVNCSAPVIIGDKMYWGGTAKLDRRIMGFYCIEYETGKLVYWLSEFEGDHALPKVRGGNAIFAAAFAGDNKIYYVSRQGGVLVVQVGKEWKKLALNYTGEEERGLGWHCPPVPLSDGKLLLRSDWGLHCIGK